MMVEAVEAAETQVDVAATRAAKLDASIKVVYDKFVIDDAHSSQAPTVRNLAHGAPLAGFIGLLSKSCREYDKGGTKHDLAGFAAFGATLFIGIPSLVATVPASVLTEPALLGLGLFRRSLQKDVANAEANLAQAKDALSRFDAERA
jgi:hypothetical protein